MVLGESIAVSNTLTREREVNEYYELAQEFGYQVFSVIVENRHNGTSIHDIPDDTMVKMKNRFSVKL